MLIYNQNIKYKVVGIDTINNSYTFILVPETKT